MNDVSKSIGWCSYSWNPLTGCERGCDFCYARRIHERFYKTPFSDIVFHPNRLQEPAKLKKPSKIFVGSMSDIEYWDYGITMQVLNEIALYPQHTFMFLTKNPVAYCGYMFTRNCMQGLTMTCTQTTHCQIEMVEDILKYPRPFLSIEPILGCLQADIPDSIEQVIVGAMTGPGAVVPEKQWIDSIKKHVPEKLIYWKNNIKRYL